MEPDHVSGSFLIGTENTISFIGRATVTLKPRPQFSKAQRQKRERTPWMT
jgi:hypothetical protein